MIANVTTWQQQANQHLLRGEYSKAANLYEQGIFSEPENQSYYWYLGLILLLQGQETEAQMTWMLPMAEVQEEQLQTLSNELIEVLQAEANRREALGENSIAWVIRQHIREISPSDINNLLKIIQLAIKQQIFSGDEITELQIIEVIKSEQYLIISTEFLLQVLQNVLEAVPLHPASLELLKASLPHLTNIEDCFCLILATAMKIGHIFKQPKLAATFLELYLDLDANNLEILRHLAIFYQDYRNYSDGIKTAKLCYSLSQELPAKIFAIHLVLRGLMDAGGYSEEVYSTSQELNLLSQELIKIDPFNLNELTTIRLLSPSFAIPHIQDNPVNFRKTHNQIAQIFQTNLQNIFREQVYKYTQRKSTISHAFINSTKPLKIGYISYAFRQHSVGWLARWLLQHHDREKFEIHGYFVNYNLVDDFLQDWYVENVSYAHKLGINTLEITEQIHQDEIDILVDLDSITLDITSEVMALKPAPIQVTWLGWDASGIPAIDYYIADPYVLPDTAQNYYSEKIWRLPQTYIAVDGFEVGVPTLRREQLDIPEDAVIYLSTQRGYKRNVETTRWQMKIIKEVANSYLLIKGFAEQESIKLFFEKIAEEEGVDINNLRFLPDVALESVHRANLGIADIVLDTYPYNGATTTLETLWMGIPLVTRVGEQFAARNSYTMMVNAGISEGIAWTDKEYMEWGIRLGKDAVLRQEIAWKLRQSRQTAPLWNAKQFTREMENAYRQMWQKYVEGQQ
jgi:predicted O-linked N-acetylglucosamine transferase (SPINDLY family)